MKENRRALGRVRVKPVRGGFLIERPSCPVCGEPPFGGAYVCGCDWHSNWPELNRKGYQDGVQQREEKDGHA